MATKLVEYSEYCPTCKHRDKKAYEDPCNDCLNCPINEDSHKPINYKKDKKKGAK